MVGELFEQGFKRGAGLLAVFAEHITLFYVVGAFAVCEQFLVEGHQGYQIEGIKFAAVGHGLL